MNHYRRYVVSLTAASILLPTLILCLRAVGSSGGGSPASPVGRPPQIHPDYAGTVIPPNIAPLNFQVQESGSRYRVRITAAQDTPIEIASRSAQIVIPPKPWRRLLSARRGREIGFEVSVQDRSGSWQRFDTFRMTVAAEEIDPYLVYRRIHPAHSAWRDMGIYQRDLRTYQETTILTNDYFRGGCVNCHTFRNNRTDTMLVSTRSSDYGNAAVIARDGEVEKVGATFGYASWHPSGKILAYTSMKVALFLHAATQEVRDVIDLDSLLAYYDTDAELVKTAPDLAKKDRLETYPTWSPDGRFLYFCSAPLTWTSRNAIPEGFDRIRYDLVRVPYDPEKGIWGQAHTVLSAQDTGRSILLPRISPDGRWLLLSLCDYGCFPVYRNSSDLYMIELANVNGVQGTPCTALREVNSSESESWHSWSSNSRWIAFSSKRDSGTFTRTYLSYVDPNGTAHKPLVVPQRDPTHYDSCLWTYSVPELVMEPVRVTKETLGRVVRSKRKIAVQMPVTMATPKADTAPAAPYLSTRE